MQKYLLLLLFNLILSQHCGKPEDPVLARFDQEVIFLSEFRLALADAKMQNPDPKIAREELLDEIIAQKLLANEARNRGIQLGEAEEMMIAAYRDECLRQEFYNQQILPEIQIENTLRDEVNGFRQMQRHLQYLLFNNPAPAEQTFQALRQGEPFEKFLTVTPESPGTGGDWGWMRWEDLEYPVAMAAFRLANGEFSQPIPAQNRVYIVRVVDIKPDTDFHQNPDATTARILHQKFGEQRQAERVAELMQNVRIQARSNVLQQVSATMQQFFASRPTDPGAPDAWQAIEASLWEMRDTPLFLINDSTFTVGQFLNGLTYAPVRLLHQQFKLVLDDAIRRYFLARHAAGQGLAPAVAPRVEMFANRKRVELLEKKLEEKFSVTGPEIDEKFRELSTRGPVQASLEEATPWLTRQILQEKAHAEASRLARHVREKTEVTINYRLLHEFE